jgi:hypothetical protein
VGQVRERPTDALLLFAYFSQSVELLNHTRDRLLARFGPLANQGPRFAFTDTDYYRESMGDNLHKELIAVDRLLDQSDLPEIKIATNELEVDIARSAKLSVPRAVNIDPGMIDLGKLMLASTKNHAHRIYVRAGIFVEVTLYLCEGQWAGWPWTYPDYRRPEVHTFCHQAREFYRVRKATPT